MHVHISIQFIKIMIEWMTKKHFIIIEILKKGWTGCL